VLQADVLKPREGKPSWVRVVLTELGLLVVASVLVGSVIALTGQMASGPPAPAAPPAPATIGAYTEERGPRGDLTATRILLERATGVLTYAQRFGIPTDLSMAIYDIAVEEGISPELAYRLIKVESNFRRSAESHAGALGYTQVQLATARGYLPDVTAHDLYQRDTNLRVGFRYLRDLLRRFDGDLTLALVAYNRGPTKVDSIHASGGDPRNGYQDLVLTGVRGEVRASPVSNRKGSD
jgi:soluble lytic murein transglycosylase-like protein